MRFLSIGPSLSALVIITSALLVGLVGTTDGYGLVSHRNGASSRQKSLPGMHWAGMRLRGGNEEEEKELQAHMALERAKVWSGWYNANASDLFPWDGWETNMRDEMQGAAHVGFLGGTGRWLGPSLEQVNIP